MSGRHFNFDSSRRRPTIGCLRLCAIAVLIWAGETASADDPSSSLPFNSTEFATEAGAIVHEQPFRINKVGTKDSFPGWLTSISYPTGWNPRQLNYYGSNVGLVFGCVRYPDTLVCMSNQMFWPAAPMWGQVSVVKRYGIPQFAPYDPSSRADHEIYCASNDTTWLSRRFYRDPSGDTILPIGIELHQTTMGWQRSYLSRSIIIDNWIVNISNQPIQRGCLGVGLFGGAYNGAFAGEFGLVCEEKGKSICGFIHTMPGIVESADDTFNLAWVASVDGDPECTGGTYGLKNPTAALGLRIIRAPRHAPVSFNWWACGWGPRQIASLAQSPLEAGQPRSQQSLYRMLTNHETDFDQVMSAVDMSGEGWTHPPPLVTETIAMNCSPALVLSVGPLAESIAPGDSIAFTYAIVMGDDFHTDPGHFARTFDVNNPAPYLNGLNFANLISTAQWTSWFFDSPGVDTDGDGYAGEYHLTDCEYFTCDTVYYTGDGVPDFKGPVPPPPPDDLTYQTFPSEIVLRWSGKASEYARDQHLGRPDFEGYRVYVAEHDTSEGFAMLAGWDREDFIRYSYTETRQSWLRNSQPLTMAEWQDWLADPEFDPREYPMPSFVTCYRDTAVDTVKTVGGTILDILTHERYSYFVAGSDNHANTYTENGQTVTNPVQLVGMVDTVIDGQRLQYGQYEYRITSMSPSKPYWVTVTSTDYGDYRNTIDPEESRPGENALKLMAVNSADVVVDSGLKVSVHPNPYKSEFLDYSGRPATYFSQGFEYSKTGKFDERDRRIWFSNLPDTATIEIYSLDGDLIRRIYHPDPYLTRYESVVGWDLITRNTQAVVSGIYIWRVTSRLGEQVGKLVIIK